MARWFRVKPKENPAESGGDTENALQEPLSARDESAKSAAENSREADSETSSGLFRHMRQRLQKTRQTLVGQIDRVILGKKEIDEDVLEELEEVLKRIPSAEASGER